ncbi:MAG: hypothetical protein Q8J76_09365, partial [Desulfobulbaceae bacterium]|nr:hypothetical protein [Desulfobulbaceae bacterium]
NLSHMGNAGGALGFVDVLTARAGSTHSLHPDLLFRPSGFLWRHEQANPDIPILPFVVRAQGTPAYPENCAAPCLHHRQFLALQRKEQGVDVTTQYILPRRKA